MFQSCWCSRDIWITDIWAKTCSYFPWSLFKFRLATWDVRMELNDKVYECGYKIKTSRLWVPRLHFSHFFALHMDRLPACNQNQNQTNQNSNLIGQYYTDYQWTPYGNKNASNTKTLSTACSDIQAATRTSWVLVLVWAETGNWTQRRRRDLAHCYDNCSVANDLPYCLANWIV